MPEDMFRYLFIQRKRLQPTSFFVFVFSLLSILFQSSYAQHWIPLGPDKLPSLLIPDNYFLKKTVGIGRVGKVKFTVNDNERISHVLTPYGGWYSSFFADTSYEHHFIPSSPIGGAADLIYLNSTGSRYWVLTGDADCIIDIHSPALGCESCQSAGIYSTKDGGKTFTGPIGKWYDSSGFEVKDFWTFPSLKIARKLVKDPSSSKRYLTVIHTYNHETKSFDGYVYMTEDGGKNWYVSLFVQDGLLKDIEWMPGRTSVIYASGRSVFRSVDKGKSWVKLTGLPDSLDTERIELEVSSLHPDFLWALVVNKKSKKNELYRSTDRGNSFVFAGSVSKSPEWRTCMVVDGKDDQRVYVSSGNKPSTVVYDGSSFKIEHSNPALHDDLHELTIDEKSGNVYASTDGGLYLSGDQGKTWSFLSNGMNMAEFWGISVAQSGAPVVLGGLQDAGTIIGLEDSSGLFGWTLVQGGDGMDGAIAADNPLRMLHNDGNNDIISFSENGGKTWSKNLSARGNSSNYRRPVAWNPQRSESFLVGYQQLFKSVGPGKPLLPVSDHTLKKPDNVQCFSIANSDTNIIYMSYSNPCWSENEEQKIFVTKNGGKEWKDITKGLSGVRWFNIVCMAVHPVDPSHIWVGFAGGATTKVMYSMDFGEHWSDVTFNLQRFQDVNCMVMDDKGERLFIGTHTGVMKWDMGSSHWDPVGDNLPVVMVSDLEWRTATQELFAGTHGCGLWKIKLPEKE